MTPSCHDLHGHLVELSAGELDAAATAALRAHAAACRPCARLVSSQAALERELRSLPGAPLGPLQAPALPARRAPRIGTPVRLLRWAAAAAAVAAMAFVAVSVGGDDAAAPVNPKRRVAGARPHISKIVQMSGSGLASDDGLLALTAGLEAVAMRRPAKGR